MRRLGKDMCMPSLIPAQKRWSKEEYGSGEGQVRKPLDVCFTINSQLVLSDVYNYRLQVLCPSTGQVITQLSTRGFEPRCVTGTKFGEVAATDVEGKCVRLFDPRSGKVTRSFGNGELERPFGISTENSGRLYVGDVCRAEVLVFTSDGQFLHTVTGGDITNPLGLAHNSKEHLLVCEADGSSIKAYSTEGDFLGDVISSGLAFPSGVTTDKDGNIAVSNSGCHKVSLYSPDGQLIKDLLTSPDHFLHDPRGLAISQKGELAVVSWEESKCLLYEVYDV